TWWVHYDHDQLEPRPVRWCRGQLRRRGEPGQFGDNRAVPDPERQHRYLWIRWRWHSNLRSPVAFGLSGGVHVRIRGSGYVVQQYQPCPDLWDGELQRRDARWFAARIPDLLQSGGAAECDYDSAHVGQ